MQCAKAVTQGGQCFYVAGSYSQTHEDTMRIQPGRVIALCALMPWLSLSHTTASAQTIPLPASSATLYNNAATAAWSWTPPPQAIAAFSIATAKTTPTRGR